MQSEQCQQLYDAMRTHKREDGSIICEAFVRAPKRRQEPAYYEVVTSPMDFIKIQQKIKTDEYEEVEDMTGDVELMVNNAKAFYKVIIFFLKLFTGIHFQTLSHVVPFNLAHLPRIQRCC